MNRRRFLQGLGGIFAAAVAPGIVRYDSLMRPVARDTLVQTGGTELTLAHGAARMLRIGDIVLIDGMGPWVVTGMPAPFDKDGFPERFAENLGIHRGPRLTDPLPMKIVGSSSTSITISKRVSAIPLRGSPGRIFVQDS